MEANKAVTPLVDALAAMWDDEGVRGGPAYIQMRDLARALECSRGDLVKAAQDAYQQPWNPDSFGGYSEEQLALIRVGFNHAMNGVYAAVKPALAKVGA